MWNALFPSLEAKWGPTKCLFIVVSVFWFCIGTTGGFYIGTTGGFSFYKEDFSIDWHVLVWRFIYGCFYFLLLLFFACGCWSADFKQPMSMTRFARRNDCSQDLNKHTNSRQLQLLLWDLKTPDKNHASLNVTPSPWPSLILFVCIYVAWLFLSIDCSFLLCIADLHCFDCFCCF